jgi:hypothetical protein
MNKRLLGVGIILGVAILIAGIVGSPAGPFGFDTMR